MLLAIDPGATQGWALFDGLTKNARLIRAGLGRPPFTPAEWEKINKLVVERPHAGDQKSTKKDLITLSIRAGEAGGLYGHLSSVRAEYIEPATWKGSLPKARGNEIVLERLTAQEKALLGAKPNHNVLDAVGIGLYKIFRLGKLAAW